MLFLSSALGTLSGALIANAAAPYCIPGQACFPSTTTLATFNASIGGRLLTPLPYGAVCFGTTYNAEACATLIKNKKELYFRQTVPAAVMYSNWELNEQGEGCLVPDEVPTAPLTTQCVLGGLATYIVNATSADDVSKAVQFAAKYNLRLRVKNTGHEYNGRSTAPGAFMIWTRFLDSVEHIPEFVPTGSKGGAEPVLAVGPAVDVKGLYAAGPKFNVSTIGGYTPSVGAAGGYIIGGGTGPIGRLRGMGVDNVVQYEVVTATGAKLTVNAFQNKDLFWALRGGGGAFAITTKVYIKAHPAFAAVNTVSGLIASDSKATYSTVIHTLVNLHPPLLAKGYTLIWQAEYPYVVFLGVHLFTDVSQVVPPEQSLAEFTSITSLSNVTNTLKGRQFATWNEAHMTVVTPTVAGPGKVGLNLRVLSRIISNDLVSTSQGLDTISQYIIDLPQGVPFILQANLGGQVSVPSTTATSVHPAWRSAWAFFNVPVFGPWTGVDASQNATIDLVSSRATDAFGSAVYYNENSDNVANWQQNQWGSNYARLLTIKKAVDPQNVFSGRQYVGSEGGW